MAAVDRLVHNELGEEERARLQAELLEVIAARGAEINLLR